MQSYGEYSYFYVRVLIPISYRAVIKMYCSYFLVFGTSCQVESRRYVRLDLNFNLNNIKDTVKSE